jgi:hypothetical protein
LVDRIASRIPDLERDRYREEWHAHIDECPGSLGKLWHVAGCARAAGLIAEASGTLEARKVHLIELELLQLRVASLDLNNKWLSLVEHLNRLKNEGPVNKSPEMAELVSRVDALTPRHRLILQALTDFKPEQLARRQDDVLARLRFVKASLKEQMSQTILAIEELKSPTLASRPPGPRSPSPPT